MPEDITEVIFKQGMFQVGQAIRITEAEDVYYSGLITKVTDKEINLVMVDGQGYIRNEIVTIDEVLDEVIQVQVLE